MNKESKHFGCRGRKEKNREKKGGKEKCVNEGEKKQGRKGKREKEEKEWGKGKGRGGQKKKGKGAALSYRQCCVCGP